MERPQGNSRLRRRDRVWVAPCHTPESTQRAGQTRESRCLFGRVWFGQSPTAQHVVSAHQSAAGGWKEISRGEISRSASPKRPAFIRTVMVAPGVCDRNQGVASLVHADSVAQPSLAYIGTPKNSRWFPQLRHSHRDAFLVLLAFVHGMLLLNWPSI